MAEMKRDISREERAFVPVDRQMSRGEEDDRRRDRYSSTLVIAAAIIAAVRTAREDIGRPSPRLQTVIFDSVNLARKILDRVLQR